MDPRTQVKVALAQRGMNQADLARQLGIKPQVLSRLFRVPVVNERSHWPAVLEALDLEVEVKPKPR